jgi:DNA polymerase-3 subunit gamma/tau
MAYEVTATRRRPQKFSDLVGQEFVVATLENSIRSGKIAHAYLFSGPRGCGKTTSARILAKMLNCEKGVEHAPCGECSACKEIANGSCMDVIEIDGASNTSVNDIRQIKDEVLFPPNSFKYKIYIIDEVHMLSTSAFNALLKTIEEPPPYVIFIFATTELHKVPATIKSRCQQFNFRLGSIEQIKDILHETVKDSGIEADDEALYWIARESTGSFRDAYTLFDQVAAFSDGKITYDKIRDKLGITGVEQLNELCEVCISANTAQAIEYINKILENGVSIEQFITNLTDYLRNLLLIKSGITKEAILGQSAQRYSKATLDAWSQPQLEHALAIFLQLFRDVRYSLNPKYELELNISRLCWLSDWVSAKALKNAIAQAKHILTSETNTANSNKQPLGSDTTAKIAKASTLGGMTKFSVLEGDQPQGERSCGSQGERSCGSQGEPPTPFVNGGDQNLVTAPTQINSVPVTPDNLVKNLLPSSKEDKFADVAISPNVSIDELKDITIKEYGRLRPLIAASLMQTSAWKLEGSKISATIALPFTKKQLDEWQRELNAFISHIWQKKVTFEVALHKVEKKETFIPESVEYVCDVFKGSVTAVDKKKKIQQTDT